MGQIIGKKKRLDKTVWDAALERMNDIFDRADQVTVGFSGGKDSTVCLNLAYMVAKERNRLPLVVHHFDEEAIVPTTVDYVRRVSQLPGIDLKWWCLPILHRNGCSRQQPYWYPWNPEEEHLWTRPKPPEALGIDDLPMPGFVMSYDPDTHTNLARINHLIADPKDGLTAHIVGIRADESMRRFQSVARSKVDNYYSTYSYQTKKSQTTVCDHVLLTQPIYDWSDRDVWVVVNKEGWDYNHAYDIYRKMGVSTSKQRVAPPYGEEPMQALWTFSQAWPELWGKMSKRVKGAATGARYAHTELYAFSKAPVRNPKKYPQPMDFIVYLIKKFPEAEQKKIAAAIKQAINYHRKEAGNVAIKETEQHPKSGISWSILYMIALRGDLKNRKLNQLQVKARADARKAEEATSEQRAVDGAGSTETE